ncbi:sporulation protein YunB [Paenibacillus sp. Soil766]|uniref:sporulation protein YunB n=1 Tax=Paenibacillus sp. Soil766 TaxID=1736404 RepID=UPI001F18F796|nr:sporulation protein YunB [Paenibacillus sp. Soil766]
MKTSRKKVLWIGLLILVLFCIQFFIFLERNLRPPLMNLAKVRVKQIATQAINSAIADHVAGGTNAEELIDWKMDKNNKITGFMLNYNEHMRITSEAIKTVQGELNNLESTADHIPLGQAMNSAILASFGPDIPIRLLPVGSVKVDINTRTQNVGINMVMFEVYVHIVAEVSVIIPFDSETEIVETEIPISYSLVVGDVPTYYYDNKGNPVGSSKDGSPPPSITLPTIPHAGATSPTPKEGVTK